MFTYIQNIQSLIKKFEFIIEELTNFNKVMTEIDPNILNLTYQENNSIFELSDFFTCSIC